MVAERVMITGGRGFLGRHVVQRFQAAGIEVYAPVLTECDLRVDGSAARAVVEFRPDIVIHAASDAGGMGRSQGLPLQAFSYDMLMTVHLLHAVEMHLTQKLVIVGSARAWCGLADGDLEDAGGPCMPIRESREAYGLAKRALYLGSRGHGVDTVCLLLADLYGPWYRQDAEEQDLVASMIRKFVKASREGSNSVTCWGSDAPIGELLHVVDAAEAIYVASHRLTHPEPLCVGTGVRTTARELATLLKAATGFTGEIVWSTTNSVGAAEKALDIARIQPWMEWIPMTPLDRGLLTTMEWFGSEPRRPVHPDG